MSAPVPVTSGTMEAFALASGSTVVGCNFISGDWSALDRDESWALHRLLRKLVGAKPDDNASISLIDREIAIRLSPGVRAGASVRRLVVGEELLGGQDAVLHKGARDVAHDGGVANELDRVRAGDDSVAGELERLAPLENKNGSLNVTADDSLSVEHNSTADFFHGGTLSDPEDEGV